MRIYFKFGYRITLLSFSLAFSASAQDLGPACTKVKDGVYTILLLKRVGEMAAQGKSLAEIKTEHKMAEYADWYGQDRLGLYIDAAYRSVKE